MSVTDVGSQSVSHFYKFYLNADTLSDRVGGIIEPGVYSGLILTKETDSSIRVAVGECEISDGAVQVKISFGAEFVVTSVSASNPFVVIRYTYVQSETDKYAEVLAVGRTSIQANDIVLGEGLFSAGVLSGSFNYNLRTVSASTTSQTIDAAFRVTSQTTPTNTVYVIGGTFNNGRSLTTLASGSSSTFTSPSANPRKDLLYVDTAGSLQILEGAEAGSPVVPDFAHLGLPLAVISRYVGVSEIYEKDILPVRPYREAPINNYDEFVAETSIEAPSVFSVGDPLYNVKAAAIGAKGNGTDDDHTAVSGLVTTINSAGGGIMYFPFGIYPLSDELLFSAAYGTTLQGDGPERTELKLTGSPASNAFLRSVAGGKIILKDLTLSVSHTDNDLRALYMTRTTVTGWKSAPRSLEMENVVIRPFNGLESTCGFLNPLYGQSLNRPLLKDVVLKSKEADHGASAHYGIQLTSGVRGARIERMITQDYRYPIYMQDRTDGTYPMKDIIIKGCHISNNYESWRGIELRVKGGARDIIIEGNTIVAESATGGMTSGILCVLTSGNTTPAVSCNISNNIIRDSSTNATRSTNFDGIELRGAINNLVEDFVVEGNNISYAEASTLGLGNGIYLQYAQGNSIINNQISGHTSGGITARGIRLESTTANYNWVHGNMGGNLSTVVSDAGTGNIKLDNQAMTY